MKKIWGIVLLVGPVLGGCGDSPTIVTRDPGAMMLSKVGSDVIQALDLGDLTGYQSAATALNEAGQIVGYSAVSTDETRGFLWDGGTTTDLGSFGGAETRAYGINEAGVVVGESEDLGGATHAFLWSDDKIRPLNITGSVRSTAYAVSDGSPTRIVGSFELELGYPLAFVYDVETDELFILHKLLDEHSKCSRAFDVNNRNRVVGVAGTSAFVWDGGSSVTYLPDLGGGASAALAINEADQIAGVALDRSDPPLWHAVMWKDGAVVDLGPPLKPGLPSAAYGLNDAGQAVGNSGTLPSLSCGSPGPMPILSPTEVVAYPFVVDDVPLVNLSILSDSGSGNALDINNHGVAVGWSGGERSVVAVRWTIEFIPTTPEDATEQLVVSVADLEDAGTVTNGTVQSLMGKLDAVTRQLNKGNVTPALKLIEAFVKEVEMLVERGELSQEEAAELLAAAQQAIALLTS